MRDRGLGIEYLESNSCVLSKRGTNLKCKFAKKVVPYFILLFENDQY